MVPKARKRQSKNRRKSRIKKRGQKKRLTLKRAMRAVAQMLYKHLVKLPEEERERNIAAIERAVAKKFKRH
jgi:hypothetical protein